jgi:hypothetical protein
MTLRGFDMKNKFIPGLVFVIFYLISACGAEAPEIGENFCPEIPNQAGAGGTSMVTVSVSATVTSTSQSITSVGSSMGSGGMELPKYDVPNLDEIASRLHSCHKFSYVQLGNFLRSRGAIIPQGNLSDTKATTTPIFGQNVTLSSVFGGSGNSCEMAITNANGTNDPVCSPNETCFCNQDDKTNQVNRSCLDVGNNSPDAADGYCVAKPATAGYLYFAGKDALGVPRLDSRLAEKEEHSTASAMKLMDIFIQAAPQIIANISDPIKAPACSLNGINKPMFASDGSCVEESVSCLIGTPATDDHILLCNLLVDKADKSSLTDVSKKRIIVVATLLAAAHSCQ